MQIYRRRIPIPSRLAMAFGLGEGSVLYLVPLTDEEEEHKYGLEIMVSPVPPESWRSVCRLSVRLLDVPHALAIATEFLTEQRINILFSQSSSTIAHRAHWDAMCDLRHMPEFAEFTGMSHDEYVRRMPKLLDEISADLSRFMNRRRTDKKVFPERDYRHGQFNLLTGLNNASFISDYSVVQPPCTYVAGGIEISQGLADLVISESTVDRNSLPDYAMITGNTEQSYLRILFLRSYQSLFSLTIDVETRNFAAGGIGILRQILHRLPESVNLIQTSSRFIGADGAGERGRIEIIAHWKDRQGRRKLEEAKAWLESEMPKTDLQDIAGQIHRNAIRVKFDDPETIYPRVFVSYSTQSDPAKLNYLIDKLSEDQFTPVLGTDLSKRRMAPSTHSWKPPADVVSQAFDAIKGCVALVSLQLEHPEFLIPGKQDAIRKIVPPWTVAEEVWAWAHDIKVWRLRDETVEQPRYHRDEQEVSFRADEDGKDYKRAVDTLLRQLGEYRSSPAFATIRDRARQELWASKYSGEHH